MGLINFLKRLFGGVPTPPTVPAVHHADAQSQPADPANPGPPVSVVSPQKAVATQPVEPPADAAPGEYSMEEYPEYFWPGKIRLAPFRYKEVRRHRQPSPTLETTELPYQFAQFSVEFNGYLDLSQDGDNEALAEWQLPVFHTPQQLADWLELPVGQVAWLIHRFSHNYMPENEKSAHYIHRWIRKRSGGWRLLEAPKPTLKKVQTKILKEILDRVPKHANAHGFVAGRSIRSNAEPHVGRRAVVKLDLANFYPSVKFSRVVAIFRSLGYSREAGIWLARLCTSDPPADINLPTGAANALQAYLGRHLPQGAPTSPALANLSAYSLDIRLTGLADSFSANYTRYADDLTFSGSDSLIRALPSFLPLVNKIILAERFLVNRSKRHVLRNNQRQSVTGVVVNQKPNVSRREFDRLKAILTNCVKLGPESQNRENHPDFMAHLQGRVAHVKFLNPQRGAKLQALFQQINWGTPYR